MPRTEERVYYVWHAHMEGTTDCYVLSISEHNSDGVGTVGGPEAAANFIWTDIRAMPFTSFAIKTISGPDMILLPRVFNSEYINHSLVCRWPLSAEEMVKLSDLVYEELRKVRHAR